jgi:hypothetical protein
MGHRILRYLLIILLMNFSRAGIIRAQEIENSVIWEISGNGLEKSSCLFGIINFMPEEKCAVSGRILRAMDESDLFITKMPHNRASQKEFK